MVRIPKEEAAELAEAVLERLGPQVVPVVVELLSDADELSARDLARVGRAAASWRRKLEELPAAPRRRKGS